MKTRIAILLLGLFITGSAFAIEPVPSTKVASKAVAELLSEEISYPSFASENKIECYVVVSIIVKSDGTLDVDAANCKSEKMKAHVVKSIEELQNDDFAQYAGQNVLVKVKFLLID